MATIYIIAGPPGVGKSTSGGSVVPNDLIILDPDQIANKYKTEGFDDYKDIGNLKFNDLVKKQLFTGNDFVIELNLGFQTHYDFVKSLKSFNNENTLEVILFYTDDINLCYQRAQIRYQSGLHYVDPNIIEQMYENTMPLLLKHISLVSKIIAVDVTGYDIPNICFEFNEATNQLVIKDNLPNWTKRELIPFLEDKIYRNQSEKVKTSIKKRKGLHPVMVGR